MSLSLKWKIQLWHALILGLVLMVLGAGFYFYEKAHRLAEIDQELDTQIHPIIGPLTNFEKEAHPGFHPRSQPPKPGQQGANPTDYNQPDNSLHYQERGGWMRRRVEGKPRENLMPNGPVKFNRFESAYVPQGFYAKAERKDDSTRSYISSNFPDIDLPEGLQSGYFIRYRDTNYREIYHETLMFRVLIGLNLSNHYKGLTQLKLQISGGVLIIFIFGVSIGGFLVSRSIRPLISIEEASAKVAKGALSERIPELPASGANELKNLSANLNNTFAQLETSFQRQIRFTADASHELRTPLTALLAQIEHGVKRPRSDEEYARILEVCGRSGKRIQRITEQLIELSRYDSGRVEMDFEEISLVSMLSSLAEELEPYVEKQGSHLTAEVVDGLITCDPFRLEQVITNLINNALQHNQFPITITLRAYLDNNGFRIEVTDTGKGIQAENIDKLFDRFTKKATHAHKVKAVAMSG